VTALQHRRPSVGARAHGDPVSGRGDPVSVEVDIASQAYADDPASAWRLLRRHCPVVRSRWTPPPPGGSPLTVWMPVRAADIVAVATDPVRFSSRAVTVVPFPGQHGDRSVLPLGLPPITADPPEHGWTRRLLLPWFAHHRVASWEPLVRARCRAAARALAGRPVADLAHDYARRIPAVAVAALLGLPDEDVPLLEGWADEVLHADGEPDRRRRALVELLTHLDLRRRRRPPGVPPGLLDAVADWRRGSRPVDDGVVLGMAALPVLAGIDTTAAAIGATIWHLLCRPGQLRLLAARPSLVGRAAEEVLRLHAPVTMARQVVAPTVLGGHCLAAGDRVLLPFGAANRDPDHLALPDRAVVVRGSRHHVTFGAGPHRCVGAALARLQLRVAVETWMTELPDARLADPAQVHWTTGQVRGLASCPVLPTGRL
jgi:cytochrome P450